MSASETQLNLFARGLTAVLAAVGEDQQSSELRLFRVPALNFEALWISHEGRDESRDQGKDMLIPLHTVGQLPQFRPIPLQDALGALREAARPLMNMDDTMGA